MNLKRQDTTDVAEGNGHAEAKTRATKSVDTDGFHVSICQCTVFSNKCEGDERNQGLQKRE